ncbi:cyclic nucleotide-binding/CBS domain-containing protein [Spongiibacter sp. KMU-158]|uniref:Cyclic nucleotide-binding/CBS domain-containing protein n=1 Tax=Spongiibacter pelagi TaxID=2760804 RepID=A0A927C336_9GAMM|nr:DUF294 nucleotidyltransferase-like domain-containing protein [Spongiibacter pelagi]MBD2858942.1 cyclic nucleotide-binding/CBS domain-containing protein [Spongiibacter pelagi]
MEANHPELALISDFLANCLPFDSLDSVTLLELAEQFEIAYYRHGHRFSVADGEGLLLLRSGAVDQFGEEGISQRLESGESFILPPETQGVRFTAFEDSLIYHLPEDAFAALCARFRHVDRYFRSRRERRLRRAARYRVQADYYSRAVADVMSSPPLTVTPETSIFETAELMTAKRVSSVLVERDGQLLGIVTDRDLRSRVLAAGRNGEVTIISVMTQQPRTVALQANLFDAVLIMADKRVHHLPVVDEQGRACGMVTTSDIQLAREDDPLFFVQRIGRANSEEQLATMMQRLPEMFRQWVAADTQSHQIARLTTTISDAVTRRLIELAQLELGPAPAKFCWLGFGSQARGEQLLGGDQDNGLLIEDGLNESQKHWFEQLGKRVCDGLNACGYVYCPGGVMASTPEWRKELGEWRKTVDAWLRSPSSAAVMRVSIFFDLRSIYGEVSLCENLQIYMLSQTQKNSIFLASLAENVLSSTPPLGLFGRLLVERGGEHSRELDLKKRGILPIVEMTRLHALANGLAEVNTYARLHALAKMGVISLADSRNMEDAYTLINSIRLKQQARQLADGETPNHFLKPESLSRLQRQHLKQAFGIVRQAQDSVRLNYRSGI